MMELLDAMCSAPSCHIGGGVQSGGAVKFGVATRLIFKAINQYDIEEMWLPHQVRGCHDQ